MSYLGVVLIVLSIAISVKTEIVNAQTNKMTFTLVGNGGNCNGCEWVKAEGEITTETPSDFDEFIKKYGSGYFVLNSPGGNLIAGLELGQRFRKHKVHTEIGQSVTIENTRSYEVKSGVCASACAYAFLGGERRTIGQKVILKASDLPLGGSKFGVHKFFRPETLTNFDAKSYTGKDLDIEQKLTAAIAVYLVSMGIDASLIGLASNTDAQSMRWLTPLEIEALRITYKPEEFQPWVIEAYRRGAIAYTRSKDEKSTVTIFCQRQKGVSVIVASPYNSEQQAAGLRECSIENEHNVLGVKIPTSNIQQGPKVNGKPTLQFNLPVAPIGNDETIELNTARVCYTKYNLSKVKMAESIKLALRNCI
jgi:hypothetical protein